jgi:PIN domain nuclease of toxin-antitoxin system
VRLLLDTNVLLWWLSGHAKLSRQAQECISNPGNEILVSSASIWEIAIKEALGRVEVDLDQLKNAVAESGFQPLLIAFAHAVAVNRLPRVHGDPFDRMLVAQASVEKLRIVSGDRVFERYSTSLAGFPPIIV